MAQAKLDDLPPFVSFPKAWHSAPSPVISPTRPELSLSGRNVLVVGGGAGIGRAVAVAAAQADAASVALVGRRADYLEESAAGISDAAPVTARVLRETADVTDGAQLGKALDAVVSAVGNIHVLVNAAGWKPPSCPLAVVLGDDDFSIGTVTL